MLSGSLGLRALRVSERRTATFVERPLRDMPLLADAQHPFPSLGA
jgi:hypothetical protein